MYPITASGLTALRNDAVQSVKIVCTPTKGTAFNITDKDLIGAVTVDWSSITGSKIDLGSACMSELSFTLENTDGAFDDKVFEGAQLYVTTSFSTGSVTETVPIGYYTVDSPPRKLRSIKITAYDRMAKFNRAYDSELAYPATLYQIIADACTKCGVSQKLPTNTLHRGVSVPKRPETDNLTYRQVLLWAAELMGVSLYIDYDGKLTGGWYATKSNHTAIKASDRFTSGNTDFAESNIVFTGVRIVGNDENKTEYLAGTKDYAFNIEGNLLAQSDMNLSTLAAELKTARCGLTYTPMSCTTHSFPHLRPLDVMNFETAQGTKKVVLTNVKWQSQNRCTKLEGKGETATQSGYATMGAFTPKQQAVLEQTRAQQQASISDMEQATLALNETIANSMGLYVTRKADSNGAAITYYHDQPTLEGSSTIYCRNAGGYAWTNSGWNSGSPAWQYGVSKDGDAVIRSIAANKISASYITTDILSSPTGKFSFNLDTGKITASDIDINGGNINIKGHEKKTYYYMLTADTASTYGFKSAADYAADATHSKYITADWLTPTDYPTTSPFFIAAGGVATCKMGDSFRLGGEVYNRAFHGSQLDVRIIVAVDCVDAKGNKSTVNLYSDRIPFSSDGGTLIDKTLKVNATTLGSANLTPTTYCLKIGTFEQGTKTPKSVTGGWYAVNELIVARTTISDAGGSLKVSANGYTADLSSGVLGLSYTENSDTQQFFSLANTRLYSSADDYKWYATFVSGNYDLAGHSNAGFKFGSSGDDTKDLGYVSAAGDANSDLLSDWWSTYAKIEANATTIRKTLVTNPLGYNQFAGLTHYRPVGGLDVYSAAFGVGAPGGKASGAIEVCDKNNKIIARSDMYQSADGEVTLKLQGNDSKCIGYIIVKSDGVYVKYGNNTEKKIS